MPGSSSNRGWLGVYLDVAVDWDEIADLVTAAWRQVATRRQTAELDAGGNPPRKNP